MASSSLGHCNEVGSMLKGETFIVGEEVGVAIWVWEVKVCKL